MPNPVIPQSRPAIGTRVRFEVLRRCNFACYYCGTPAAFGAKRLQMDHVIPVTLGGTNAPWNLVAACWDCNAGKANGVPDPDLIRRVREDYCAYAASTGLEVVSCRFCSTPVQCPPDEGTPYHCALCEAVMLYGYNAGAGRAREWVAP